MHAMVDSPHTWAAAQTRRVGSRQQRNDVPKGDKMELSLEEVDHVAGLARLGLTAEEREQRSTQICDPQIFRPSHEEETERNEEAKQVSDDHHRAARPSIDEGAGEWSKESEGYETRNKDDRRCFNGCV